MLTKISNFIKTHQSDVVLALAIVLITATSFNLGKIKAVSEFKQPLKITDSYSDDSVSENNELPTNQNQTSKKSGGGGDLSSVNVVASKNSKGKLYHFPWCPGAGQISEKNKITFTNEAAAILAGFTLASNCRR